MYWLITESWQTGWLTGNNKTIGHDQGLKTLIHWVLGWGLTDPLSVILYEKVTAQSFGMGGGGRPV